MPDQYQVLQQARQLVKQEDGARGLVAGGIVYETLTFVEDGETREIIPFTTRQYVFLKHYHLGVSLQDAAIKAGLTPETAQNFIDRPKTQAWLLDQDKKNSVKKRWLETSKWWEIGDEIISGTRKVDKNQMEVYREFGKRAHPVSEHGPSQTKIEITIDPEAIERSKIRRKAIEAQIVTEAQS